jgi:hypothetical protein
MIDEFQGSRSDIPFNVLRAYCEHGAVRRKLRHLQHEGRLILIGFPYDPNSRAKAIHWLASPSKTEIRDLNLSIGEMNFTLGQMVGSEKHSEIERIIGRGNRRDVLHIDSAYRSRCACFFTCDSDILAHRIDLESLLGIRFFHPDDDWDSFLEFLNDTERQVSAGSCRVHPQ